MEKSVDDCYYFLYSVCKRGENCAFRHNPFSKQNPVLCEVWDKTKQCREDCPFRHSYYHLQRKRSEDYCFWEDKETGCTKDFCEFKHKNPEKDLWKESGVKSLDQVRKEKNARKKLENTTVDIDPEEFERERREKRMLKQKRSLNSGSERSGFEDREFNPNEGEFQPEFSKTAVLSNISHENNCKSPHSESQNHYYNSDGIYKERQIAFGENGVSNEINNGRDLELDGFKYNEKHFQNNTSSNEKINTLDKDLNATNNDYERVSNSQPAYKESNTNKSELNKKNDWSLNCNEGNKASLQESEDILISSKKPNKISDHLDSMQYNKKQNKKSDTNEFHDIDNRPNEYASSTKPKKQVNSDFDSSSKKIKTESVKILEDEIEDLDDILEDLE